MSESLQHSLLNANEQIARYETALRLANEIRRSFIGPKVIPTDKTTAHTVDVLIKLLRDDLAEVKKVAQACEAEMTKRSIHVA